MFTTFVTEGPIPQTADQLVYGTVFATNLRNYYFLTSYKMTAIIRQSKGFRAKYIMIMPNELLSFNEF